MEAFDKRTWPEKQVAPAAKLWAWMARSTASLKRQAMMNPALKEMPRVIPQDATDCHCRL